MQAIFVLPRPDADAVSPSTAASVIADCVVQRSPPSAKFCLIIGCACDRDVVKLPRLGGVNAARHPESISPRARIAWGLYPPHDGSHDDHGRRGPMAAPSKAGEFWRLIVGVSALAFGCFLLGAAWQKRPLSKEQLSLIEQVGPLYVQMPLVRYGRLGRRESTGTYRTQDIMLTSGRISGAYRPPRYLWVDDLDRVQRGQKLRFLVDPHDRVVYEAVTNGKKLLSYEESAANLNDSAQKGFMYALGFLAMGGFLVAPVMWRRWHMRETLSGE